MYPIQSLMNMEYMLYGNSPNFGNTAVPSMINGYCATSPYLMSYPYASNLYTTPSIYNTQAAYNNPAAYNAQSIYNQPSYDSYVPQSAQNTSQTAVVSQADIDKIAKFYEKSSEPKEGLIGAIIGGAAFGAINNPRILAHPVQSVISLGATEKMFKPVKDATSALSTLWNSAETNNLIREAYFRMNKVEARSKFRLLNLFRKRYSESDYNTLKSLMDEALASGQKEKIAEATAKLQHAYTNDGFVSKGFGYVKRLFGGKTKPNTITEALKDTEAITATADGLLKSGGKLKFTDALKRGGGIGGAIFMMGLEFLMGWGNIKEAFSKDNKTGMTQLGQTLVKGAGSAAGWALGEAAGAMAAASICAKIGTAISPGLGTAIGGIIGLVGGSIGCWITGKITKALVGKDVGEKVKVEKMKKTPEGHVQLLQLTASQKNIPLDVQQSIQNVYTQYASAA